MDEIIDELKKSKWICKNTEFIMTNKAILSNIKSEFYNIETQKLFECLIGIATETEPEIKESIGYRLNHFFNDDNISNYIAIRGPDTLPETHIYKLQAAGLIHETYIGIKHLNDIRKISSSFKYVYGIAFCNSKICTKIPCTLRGDIPHMIEESLIDAIPIDDFFKKLSVDQQNINIFKSISLQLLMALTYASKKNINNFPLDICVRSNELSGLIPIYENEKIKYIESYGNIPVYYNFTGVYAEGLIKFSNPIPKSLSQESLELYTFLTETLKKQNKDLYDMLMKMTDNNIISKLQTPDFYDSIMETSTKNRVIFACSSNIELSKCYTVNNYLNNMSLSYMRVDNYFQSLITRLDYLRYMYRLLKNPDDLFIASSIINKYSNLLIKLYNVLEPRIKNTLFLGERLYNSAISIERYSNINNSLIKPDIIFIKESSNILYTQYLDTTYIKKAVDTVYQIAIKYNDEVSKLNSPSFKNKLDIAITIKNLRKILIYIIFFETTNNLINHFNNHITKYPYDTNLFIQQSTFMKEKYDTYIYEFNQSGKTLDVIIPHVSDMDDAIIVSLYHIFIGDISTQLNSSLEGYKYRLNQFQIDQFYNKLHSLTITALDPIVYLYKINN